MGRSSKISSSFLKKRLFVLAALWEFSKVNVPPLPTGAETKNPCPTAINCGGALYVPSPKPAVPSIT